MKACAQSLVSRMQMRNQRDFDYGCRKQRRIKYLTFCQLTDPNLICAGDKSPCNLISEHSASERLEYSEKVVKMTPSWLLPHTHNTQISNKTHKASLSTNQRNVYFNYFLFAIKTAAEGWTGADGVADTIKTTSYQMLIK